MILLSITWTIWIAIGLVLLLFIFGFRLYIRSMVYGQRRLREGISKKTQELRKETERAVRSEKIKEEFLANMSHEIRTPMNAVVGLVNLLLEKDPKPDQLQYLKTLKHSANHLLAVINDILDISRIEAGKLPILESVFNIRDLMESLKTMLEFRASGKGLQLQVEVHPDLSEFVFGDDTRINQILVNLGSNAVKFTESGSVIIRAEPIESPVSDKGPQDWVRFTVSDTGIGIAPERLPHMFESFTQESNTITRQYGGTGLGLAISKRLAEMLNGRIYAISEPAVGSTFTLEIPLAAAAPQNETEKDRIQDLVFPDNLHILLAEDDAFNQMVAVDTLENYIPGVRIRVAPNGKEAVVMQREDPADLILMDIQMPIMDGLEASQLIRKEEELQGRPRTPILAMTANVLPIYLEKSLAAGMNGMIPKPFQIDDLLRQIQNNLP
jgi:signal transduction histidine kinase/CheY-like chemotaxis protein